MVDSCSVVFFCDFEVFSFLFFEQKTAYELRISDWSSDVCSSDLAGQHDVEKNQLRFLAQRQRDAGFAIERRNDLITALPQHLAQHRDDRARVIDDQYFGEIGRASGRESVGQSE